MSTINPVNIAPYIPSAAPASTSSTGTSSSSLSSEPTFLADVVDLSLAGRIALGVGDGLLTSDQGQALTSQLQTISQQIQSGGSNVSQLQSQLSQQIYGDGHNGATIPKDAPVSSAEVRDFIQAGRIVNQEAAGNLTSTQASQFFSEMLQTYHQSQSGTSASATNQAQNQLSVEIYDAAHNITNPAPAP
jgi:hypothetical protein